jgi:endoglucanase
MGLNALDICFVTGLGENRVMHPHHRPSAADGVEDPVPGLISGGPNKNWPYGVTKEKLGGDVPPAKYFLDETPSADTNEIAIYWNSPAIFTFAFFNETE